MAIDAPRRPYRTQLDRRVIHFATVAERSDIALHMAGSLVSLADRRLRQLGEGPEAA